jgi:hypothetical protein
MAAAALGPEINRDYTDFSFIKICHRIKKYTVNSPLSETYREWGVPAAGEKLSPKPNSKSKHVFASL